MSEGTAIAVVDSTELAGISPSGLALGTRVWNIGVGSFFQLTASTASLVTNQVVAVFGVVGVRWIIDSGMIADGSVTLVKMANLAGARVIGQPQGASTTAPVALTGAQLTTIEQTANTTTTTLVAPGATITVSGLDGANDGDWLVYFYLKGAATTGVPTLLFNGTSDADDYCAWTEISGASTVQGARSLAAIALSPSFGAAANATGWLLIRAGAADGNYNRLGQGCVFGPSGPVIRNLGFVMDRAANVTSMAISGNANSFGAGSYLSVQKLRRVYT